MQVPINGKTLELAQGDITAQTVEVIVNAANSSLAGGSGVNGAIQTRGGRAILRETAERYPQGCPTGSAVITGAGDLPCKYVIHAVGPIWRGGHYGEPDQLRSAYQESLRLAARYERRSIAFPALSTGVYGYPLAAGCRIALQTVLDYLRSDQRRPQLVRFVLFDHLMFERFQSTLTELLESPGERPAASFTLRPPWEEEPEEATPRDKMGDKTPRDEPPDKTPIDEPPPESQRWLFD
ncbi:macro domain-containing protein [Lignipirellula cremea]|uniref:O-acetyl-ADP-ribose deacetylase n=1 Tax=Lignipirellula cremea TaxID=2528010 RepID=A0A518DND4_9BACT|nr:macro domain-containing protein [Lignipirellula cremea]QDU93323.1 O-acetyl-ADP-ribose deacetylase [Lignipirellula cremea]